MIALLKKGAWVLALPFLLGARCGGYESMGSNGGAGGEEDGETDDGGSMATGGRSGAPTFGGGPSAGSGSGASCEAFLDEEAETSVTVRIVNDTDAPLHFGAEETTCMVLPIYELSREDGVPVSDARGECSSCQLAQRVGAIGCPAICAYQPLVRLEPGQSYEVTWDGRLGEDAAMPAACYPMPFAVPETCIRKVVAPATRYVFSAVGWSDWTCGPAGGCQCVDEDGSCKVTGEAWVRGSAVQASVTIDFPNETVAEIVFE